MWMSLNAFHCSFRSSTTKLSLPAPPLQVTPQKLSNPNPYTPRPSTFPSDLHLQPLLALTLNLNLNHLMVTHLWLVENGFLSAVCVCVCVAVVLLQEVGIAGEAQDVLAHDATITYNHLFYQSVLNKS